MAAFSTLAMIGIGLAAGAGAYAATRNNNSSTSTGSRTPTGTASPSSSATPQPQATSSATGSTGQGDRPLGYSSQQPGGGRRNPSPNAEYTGDRAITRDEYRRRQTNPGAGPGTAEANSKNTVNAYAAGERARKRAAAGGSVLTGAQRGLPGPAGSNAPLTLLGQ